METKTLLFKNRIDVLNRIIKFYVEEDLKRFDDLISRLKNNESIFSLLRDSAVIMPGELEQILAKKENKVGDMFDVVRELKEVKRIKDEALILCEDYADVFLGALNLDKENITYNIVVKNRAIDEEQKCDYSPYIENLDKDKLRELI